MQRSRRALLQRRAAALETKGNLGSKRLTYKLSLSLVLFFWGLIFLLNFLISHGNGYRAANWHWFLFNGINLDSISYGLSSAYDELEAEACEFSCQETQPDTIKLSNSKEPLILSGIISDHVHNTAISKEKEVGHNIEVFTPEDQKASTTTLRKEEEAKESGTNLEVETRLKSDRISRVAPGLDEFKSRAIAAKEKPLYSQTDTVIHRLEPGGKEYNYASSKKGAKILDSNKEAKGASNILDKDKDKYLRNPCSAEEKYVIIELSEETLVDTIEIGNFEHYSSNLKDFELYNSPIYPTDNWIKLGNFTAQNVKQAQRFGLSEPKWARYLKLNMLSHYGSEFYCTLSVVEVYGVDVVEKMLEDLILVEFKRSEPEEQNIEQTPQKELTNGDEHLYQHFITEINNELPPEGTKAKKEVSEATIPDRLSDTKPPQVGRMPGDTVLKILLQKVQSLDLNFSVLERYLEELNGRYAHIFKDFDDDMSNKDTLLEKIRLQMQDLQNSKNIFAKEIGELHSWKSSVSSQLEQLAKDNIMLRSEFGRVKDHKTEMENRGLVVIFMSFVFGSLAAANLLVGMLLSIFTRQNNVIFCRISSAWFFLLLSSCIIALIMVV